MLLADRADAGQRLADKLHQYKDNAVIYALPRGGVEVAAVVARALKAPLDLMISRKIGHPDYSEYAVCAVTEDGPLICNEIEQASLDKRWLAQAEAAERAEAERRRETYLKSRNRVKATNKTAIVIDDGIATGLTMRAAIGAIKKQHPARLIVAVPVAPREVVEEIAPLVDDCIVLEGLDDFLGAIGAHYQRFEQLNDQQVLALLESAK